jgi:hypothetical protein
MALPNSAHYSAGRQDLPDGGSDNALSIEPGKEDGFDPVLLMEDGRKRKRFGLRWDESVF